MQWLAVVGLALALAACARTTATPAGVERTLEPIESMPSVSEPLPPDGEVPSEMLDEIVADAAARAGVEPGEVDLVVAEAVTWSDGSLGCPEPGMMYTQALVPGYRVVVEAGGEELSFHASESGDFRLCENPQPPLEGNPNE